MKQLAKRIGAILKNRAGLTLVEVLAATVLIAVVSVMMLYGYRTILGVVDESNVRKHDQAALTEAAATGAPPAERIPEDIELRGGFAIPGSFLVYETENGQRVTLYTTESGIGDTED